MSGAAAGRSEPRALTDDSFLEDLTENWDGREGTDLFLSGAAAGRAEPTALADGSFFEDLTEN